MRWVHRTHIKIQIVCVLSPRRACAVERTTAGRYRVGIRPRIRPQISQHKVRIRSKYCHNIRGEDPQPANNDHQPRRIGTCALLLARRLAWTQSQYDSSRGTVVPVTVVLSLSTSNEESRRMMENASHTRVGYEQQHKRCSENFHPFNSRRLFRDTVYSAL